MKNLKNILFILPLLLSIEVYSQTLIDANGDTLAVIDSEGVIKDAIGQTVGAFLANGQTTNAGSEIIGEIEGSNFKDASGALIGTIDTNNKVYDVNNDQIGEVQFGVMVVDANNHVLGRSTAVCDSKKLAAYFFFFFNQSI